MLPARNSNRSLSTARSSIRRDLEDVFDRLFYDFPTQGDGGMSRGWQAPVAIWDDNEHVYVEAEVPGFSKDELEVVVHQGNLRIWGEREEVKEDRNYWYNERSYGKFERLIKLPDIVDPDSIDAQMHDGILSVTLKKKPEAQPKKVSIRGR